MTEKFRRRWDGHEWQAYAYALVQLRYGHDNVQRVPDQVRGDGGLEFFTTDGCLIQCYAPEEVDVVAKSTSAIKQKATRDLPKLQKYESIIAGMLQKIKARRWILLCPFFDDKAIIEHIRKKGVEIGALGLSFIDSEFEALIHSQEDFTLEVDKLRQSSLGLSIRPWAEESRVLADATSEFAKRLPEKLRRAYPSFPQEKISAKTEDHVRSYWRSQNALDQLRQDHPTLWEKVMTTISSEESRLQLVGATGSAPVDQLIASLERLDSGFRQDLPTLTHAARTELANGALSDWLIRCPLDFT